MTLTNCDDGGASLSKSLMDNEPWQVRAKAAGLSQVTLAKLLGHDPRTVSRQLRGQWQSGVPRHVIAAILAWELMTPEQRRDWIARVEESE